MENSLTIEDIDDILDEIEQREPKHLLIHNDLKFTEIDNNTIDFSNVISLDVELEIPENINNKFNAEQQMEEEELEEDHFDYLIFDQKSLITGYFIVNLLKEYKLIPKDIMNNIIDLCILFTFFYDEDKDELIIMSDEETSVSSVTINSVKDYENHYNIDEEIATEIVAASFNTCAPHNTPQVSPYDNHKQQYQNEDEDEQLDEDEIDLAHISIDICNSIHSPKQDIFGQAQSPINLVTSPQSPLVSKPLNDNDFKYNPLKFNYPSFIKRCRIINNGHTVQINMPLLNNNDKDKCKLFINNRYYILNQFHFHIPSEHTIDNKQYEMEMHLVHINQKENKIAVLGFLFTTNNLIAKYIKKPSLQLTKSKMHLILPKKEEEEEEKSMILDSKQFNKMKIMKEYIDDQQEEDIQTTDDEWDDDNDDEEKEEKMRSNDFLDQFFDKLPTEKTEEDDDGMLLNDITFDYLFETSSNNFIKNIETNEIEIDMEIFEYMGSLTTPPYTEGVQWLVSKRIHFMNEMQLQKLSKCWQNKNNARDVQEYFGRTVSLRSKSSLRVL